MASSVTKFSYQRLRNEAWFDEETIEKRSFKRTKGWSRIMGRRRPRVRIPGLRRFMRRKARFLSSVKVSWGKALKRLKKGQVHMNDLLAGNFMFMNVCPAPFKCGREPSKGHDLHGLSSRYSLGRIA
ncbi:hypothetical protein L1049_027615 [Liquidambar formosana]|uniref:Uncharacterized protein n=1 Tax=Liquidambar formosana TaxID=63359 RepID=A0AAP0RJ30_LIQFO